MAKQKTTSQLHKKIWVLCGKLNRIMNPPTCYTCGAGGLSGSNWHPGHGKPKGALPLRFKYDMRNIKSQCMRCNCHLGGCSDIFIAKLEKEKEGKAFLKEACVKIEGHWEIKHTTTMGGVEAWGFLTNLISEYEQILNRGNKPNKNKA